MATKLVFGCGYLGQIVARRWLADGHRVFALTRGRSEALHTLGVEPLIGDVTDPASLNLPKVDAVLYAIGMDRSAGKSMREVYLDGLQNVLKKLPPPGRFLYVSSTSVYGQTDGSWVDESSPTEPREESGRILLECEQLLRQTLPDAIVLRFAGIYGPGRVLRRAALERGEPLVGDAEKWLNLIHVEDGADVAAAAEERGRLGATYTISDGHPVTRRDFYTRTAELLAAPPAIFVNGEPAEMANRRVSNRRIVEDLQVHLLFPTYREGLEQAIPSDP